MVETATTTVPHVRSKSFYPAYLDERNTGDLPRRGKMTVDKFVVGEYLPHIRATNKSWVLEERLLRRHVSPVFGKRAFRDIKRSEVIIWLRSLVEKGLGNSTANRIMAAFKAVCSFAETCGVLPFGNTPCYKIPHLPAPGKDGCPLSPKQLARLKKNLEKTDCKQALALRLIMATGARKREILDARWEDVDMVNRRLRVTQLCSASPRYISLNDEAVDILMSISRHSKSEWVFPGRRGDKPLTDIYQFWNRLRKETGMPQMKIEDLRHNCLASAAPMNLVYSR